MWITILLARGYLKILKSHNNNVSYANSYNLQNGIGGYKEEEKCEIKIWIKQSSLRVQGKFSWEIENNFPRQRGVTNRGFLPLFLPKGFWTSQNRRTVAII